MTNTNTQITKNVSGGQTGGDRGGLDAAIEIHLGKNGKQ